MSTTSNQPAVKRLEEDITKGLISLDELESVLKVARAQEALIEKSVSSLYFENNKDEIARRYAEAVRVENEAVAAKDEAQVEFVKRITALDEPSDSSSP